MKKIIARRLFVIMLLAMIGSLGLNSFLQMRAEYQRLTEESQQIFQQMEQVLSQSGQSEPPVVQTDTNLTPETDTASARKEETEYAKTVMVRARALSYIIQQQSWLVYRPAELQDLLELLGADSFDFLDEDGRLYASTTEARVGGQIDSTESLAYLKPLMEDRSMEIHHVSSAEDGRKILYAALWQEDETNIIQVGVTLPETGATDDTETSASVQPEPALPEIKQEQPDYTKIVTLLDLWDDSVLYMINSLNQTILASNQPGLAGQDAVALGLEPQTAWKEQKTAHCEIDGQKYFCVYKAIDQIIVMRGFREAVIHQKVVHDGLFWMAVMVLLFMAILIMTIRFLNKTIIRGFSSVNRKLVQITQGDLDVKLAETSSREFAELSFYINEMVSSLMNMTDKMSLVFDEAELPICVYEYGPGMKRVMATSRLPEILRLSSDEAMALLSDNDLFSRKLDEIQRYPIQPNSRVYRLPGPEEHYIRMEAFFSDKYMLGVLVDETQSILERKLLERERDIDLLTDLYSRRAFFSRIEELFSKPQELGQALLVMADADGLKNVNDQHGHESGDLYLQAIADVLRSCHGPYHIVGRRSGDEFILFTYGCSSKQELIAEVTNMLRQRDRKSVILKDGAYVNVRFSVGLAYFPEDSTDLETLLRLADERMYEEKRQRKAGR